MNTYNSSKTMQSLNLSNSKTRINNSSFKTKSFMINIMNQNINTSKSLMKSMRREISSNMHFRSWWNRIHKWRQLFMDRIWMQNQCLRLRWSPQMLRSCLAVVENDEVLMEVCQERILSSGRVILSLIQ